MNFSNFSSLDGTATEARPLARQPVTLGANHWDDEPRLPKGDPHGGRWTKIASTEEPPERPTKPPPTKSPEPNQLPSRQPNGRLPTRTGRIPTIRSPSSSSGRGGAILGALLFFLELIQEYRARNAEQDMFGPKPDPKNSTVAVTRINGKYVFGANSGHHTHTDEDEAAAKQARTTLIQKYPEVMDTRQIGRFSNDGLFHAEATVLLRAAKLNGGSLAGKVLEVGVDNTLCDSCQQVLPLLAYELGNPVVAFTDSTGNRLIIHDKTIKFPE